MIKPVEIHVRFADLDLMGHVNNSVYLSYFEVARVYYFGELLGLDWDWNDNGILLVRNEIDYIKPVLLHDKPLITIFTEKIGNKSFVLSYELMVNGELYTKGTSTLVCFNRSKNETVKVSGKIHESLLKLIRE